MKNCSLCGGKLDRKKRCMLCGLDNTKNDDMYKHLLNKNNCEHAPLTQVHEEPVQRVKPKTYSNAKNTYKSVQYSSGVKKVKSKSSNASKGLIATITSVIAIVGALFGVVGGIVEEMAYDLNYDEVYVEEDYVDIYQYVVEEMPEDGEVYSVHLEPGVYQVGCQIPQGIYDAELVTGDYGHVSIDDNENGIYHTKYLDVEADTVAYDLQLYDGAYFTVSSNITVILNTENAQPLTAEGQLNPLTEAYKLTGKAEAGVDFEAGIYDIVYDPLGKEEYGYVEYLVTDEAGYDYSWSVYFDSDIGMETYHNVALPEGAHILISDLASVTLVPSELIYSTDYNEFYELYY